MTSTPKLLIPAADLPNAAAALYTSPAGGKGTWIDKATATNHNGAAQTVTFNHVPLAGAASNANLVVDAKSIADKATDLLPELVGKYLPPGAMLYGVCSVAAGVAFELNGRELT
jgi:hypothetical protein